MEKSISEKQQLCEKIWFECRDDLINLCRYKLQSCPDETDDVVSEAFLYLCKAIFNEEEPSNYKGWMFKVTNNLIKKKYAEINRAKKKHVCVNDIDNKATTEDVLIDNLISDKMIENLSKEVIHKLNFAEQQLYEYVYVDKMKIKEIAVKMNSTGTAVKQKKYRLKKKLKFMIKEHIENMWMS